MNYDELKDASIAYADRYDIEVSDNFDTFIRMAESRMNRVLKTRKQSARSITATVTGQEFYGLPPDYAGMRNAQFNALDDSGNESVKTLDYLNPGQMDSISNSEYRQKIYYTVIANQIQIYPAQEAGNTIELVYYQKVVPLTSDEPENWLTIDHPDVYLSGLTAEIELFAKNYDVAKGWYDRMTVAINEIDSSDEKEVYTGQPLQMRIG